MVQILNWSYVMYVKCMRIVIVVVCIMHSNAKFVCRVNINFVNSYNTFHTV